SSIEGVELTRDVAEHALNGIAQPEHERSEYTVAQIRRAVAQEMQIPEMECKANNRSRKAAFAQHLTMYLLRELRNDSLASIGKACGGRHHSTVLYAINRIAQARRADAQCDALIRRIVDQLEAL